MSSILYERIGRGYSQVRRPDARIFEVVQAALGNAQSVVNVGAGAGSYEPADRRVVGVEPSAEMRSQRSRSAAPCLAGSAEDLPLRSGSFDAAMAIYTDTANELFRPLEELTSFFPIRPSVQTIPIPHDCSDGFVHALWKRPEALLDPRLHRTMAVFSRMTPNETRLGFDRLRADLRSGEWTRKNSELEAHWTLGTASLSGSIPPKADEQQPDVRNRGTMIATRPRGGGASTREPYAIDVWQKAR